MSSVATTCDCRTRSAINSYRGATRSATSPHQIDCVAREISNPWRSKMSSSLYNGRVVRKLARYDVGQQARPRHAFFQSPLLLWRLLPFVGVLAYALTSRASILLAHVVQALKAPRNVFDLPALVRANLLALHSAAGAQSLFGTQFVNLGRDRERFSKLARFRRPRRRFTRRSSYSGSALGGYIFGVDRLFPCSCSPNSSSACARSALVASRSARGP